jgi:hypothetical protein
MNPFEEFLTSEIKIIKIDGSFLSPFKGIRPGRHMLDGREADGG